MNAPIIKMGPVLAVATNAGVLGVIYLLSDASGATNIYGELNRIGPVVLLGICLWAAYQLVRRQPFVLWSPLPWFFVACAAYFGLGPLAYKYATPASIAYMDRFYAIGEDALLRTNLLNAVGIASVCLGMLAGNEVFRGHAMVRQSHDISLLRRATLIFLALGGTVKYVFTLPYTLGLLTWTLPGAIQHLSALLGAAIVLMFVLVERGNIRFRWILYPIITSELLTGLMTFNKQEVLWTVLTVLLGQYLCRPRMRTLVVWVLGMVLLYVFFLSPFVSFARVAVGYLGTGDPREAVRAVQEFENVGREELAESLPGVQGWWIRFAYSNAQAFAMNEHDHGKRGETFDLALYSFVPRMLFPEKPIMTSGKDFTALVTGDDSYHTAPGIFGETYWNAGWSGLIAACFYVGLVITAFGFFSIQTMTSGQYAYMPIVMAGIVTGIRPDDWFIPTYIGALVEIFALYLMLRFLVIPILASDLDNVRAGARPRV